MNREVVQAYLAMTERHIHEGERCVSRQRKVVARLERLGRGSSKTARLARDILQSFEMTQHSNFAHRNHLRDVLEADPQSSSIPEPTIMKTMIAQR